MARARIKAMKAATKKKLQEKRRREIQRKVMKRRRKTEGMAWRVEEKEVGLEV